MFRIKFDQISDWPIFQHTGSHGGFHSQVVVVPSQRHGVFIGINKSPDGGARDLIAMYILDLLMGKPRSK